MTKRKACLLEYSFYLVDQGKVGSLDPRNPPKQGRIPLKRYIVIFYRMSDAIFRPGGVYSSAGYQFFRPHRSFEKSRRG
jgi:hypothetical protein